MKKLIFLTTLAVLCATGDAYAASGWTAPIIDYTNQPAPANSPHGYIDPQTAKSFADPASYRVQPGQYKYTYQGPDRNGNNYPTQSMGGALRYVPASPIIPVTQIIRKSPAGVSGIAPTIQKSIVTVFKGSNLPSQSSLKPQAVTGPTTNYYRYVDPWSQVAKPDDQNQQVVQQGSWNQASMQSNNNNAGPPVQAQPYKSTSATAYREQILNGITRLLSH